MKKLTVISVSLLLSLLLLFSVFSCKEPDNGASVPVTGIKLNRSTENVLTGDTFQLQPTISPAGATNKAIEWTSDNNAEATVDSKGLVSFLTVGDGTVKITATTKDGGHSASCTFTVGQGIPATALALDMTEVEMFPGRVQQLVATITPAEATNKVVTWASSAPNVATVVAGGLVTAVAKGTATITATTGSAGLTATCVVTVKDRPEGGQDLGSKDGLSGKTSKQYFDDMGINLGWNLGNAFDASPMETSWGNPAPTKVLFQGVKDAGFNVVRIPVTWHTSGTASGTHPIGPAPTYTLDSAFLERVVKAVDLAYEAGLVVVINIHHDDNSWLNVKNAGLDYTTKTGDYVTIMAQFTAVWNQIATRFKDYGDWLIFEGFNEAHDGGWGWNPNPATQYNVIDDWNQAFTNTVRAAGGKNTERFLVIQPLCARFERAMEETFHLPTDSTSGKQIVSVHFYYPEAFSLNGTSNAWAYNFDTEFAKFTTLFTGKGIPVIIGECGATYQSNRTGTDKATADANRITYMQKLGSTAEKNGMVPILWDNGNNTRSATATNPNAETFGLFNRTTGNVHPEQEAVVQAIVDAVNGK